MSERDLIERLAIRAARFEASPGNDLIYGQGEAQTDKEAADTIARLSEALAEARGALVDLAGWLENDCHAEVPHAHIEQQVALARAAPPRDLSQGGQHG